MKNEVKLNKKDTSGRSDADIYFREKRMDKSIKLEGSYNFDGLYYGTHRFWNEQGQIIFEAEFKDGIQRVSREFYDNGNMKFLKLFDKGIKHGKHTCWYENGKLQEESSWVNGKRHGECTKWREDGAIVYQKKFERDRLVYLREWDEQENIIAQIG